MGWGGWIYLQCKALPQIVTPDCTITRERLPRPLYVCMDLLLNTRPENRAIVIVANLQGA